MTITILQQDEITKMKADLIQQHKTLQERTLKVVGAIEAIQIVEKKLSDVDQEEVVEEEEYEEEEVEYEEEEVEEEDTSDDIASTAGDSPINYN